MSTTQRPNGNVSGRVLLTQSVFWVMETIEGSLWDSAEYSLRDPFWVSVIYFPGPSTPERGLLVRSTSICTLFTNRLAPYGTPRPDGFIPYTSPSESGVPGGVGSRGVSLRLVKDGAVPTNWKGAVNQDKK